MVQALARSRDAGLATLGWAQQVAQHLNTDNILRLEIDDDELSGTEELVVCNVIGTGLKYIWEKRERMKRVEVYEVRAELEALVSLLRRSRKHEEAGNMIDRIIN